MSAPDSMKITITKNGPYKVEGGIPLSEDSIVRGADGKHYEYAHVKDFDAEDSYLLCRCGKSSIKPFCDGSHVTEGFDGTEVASREPYDKRAEVYKGPELTLRDDERCAYARFCHRKDGDVWALTALAENDGIKEEAIEASWHCPTGRLTHKDNETGKTYEQEFDPSIVILEDPEQNASGPLFVRGGISLVSEDGQEYETRNRYALCRCGYSENKPFCDAAHIPVIFDDGSEALKGKHGDLDKSFEQLSNAADAEGQGL